MRWLWNCLNIKGILILVRFSVIPLWYDQCSPKYPLHTVFSMWIKTVLSLVGFMPFYLIRHRAAIVFCNWLCYEMELYKEPMSCFNMKTILSGITIPTMKIRCSHDSLILTMGILILMATVVGWHFYIEITPWGAPYSSNSSNLTVLPSACLQDHRDQTGLHVWVNLAITVICPLRLYYLYIVRVCIVTNCVMLFICA